jgi:hypothetical protein
MEPLLEPLLIFKGIKEMEGALEVEDEFSPLFYEFLDPPLVPACGHSGWGWVCCAL